MPHNKLPVVKLFAVAFLMIVYIQAAPAALASEAGNTDRSYPLGFGYCAQPASSAADDMALLSYVQQSQMGSSSHIFAQTPVTAQPAAVTPAGRLTDAAAGVNMKDAFQSLQSLKREEERLAHGNVRLSSLFDSGQNVLGRPVKADFRVDPTQDQSQKLPEPLAMLLLGTGLIGFARIQRRQFKD
jgi:hypothetical protein